VQYHSCQQTNFKIQRPADVAMFVRSVAIDNSREQFFALYLDGNHSVVSYALVSIGTANASMVHPREFFQRAILSGAVSLIVAHNYPSGNAEPSAADRKTTKALREAGDLLGIRLVDHVIVAEYGELSMREVDGW